MLPKYLDFVISTFEENICEVFLDEKTIFNEVYDSI
jgi:hypothetical protein